MTWLNIIAVLCAASAWLVTRRAPQHWPVAVALSLCAWLDIIRAVLPLPARVDLALCLAAPAGSFWAYPLAMRASVEPEHVEAWTEAAAALWAAAALLMMLYPKGWDWWLPLLYGIAILAGFFAGLSRWIDGLDVIHDYPGDVHIFSLTEWHVTQRTAAMLLAGDVAGLILLCRREWIAYQAGAVLAFVTGYHVWWLWRLRR